MRFFESFVSYYHEDISAWVLINVMYCGMLLLIHSRRAIRPEQSVPITHHLVREDLV